MENMEDLEWMERYFRKELNPDEVVRFNERLAADAAFKRMFEKESLVHRGLQFSQARESLKAFSTHPTLVPATVAHWLDSQALITVGGTALGVWIFSTFSFGLTNLSPENIKWVGLTVAVVGSTFLLALKNKSMNFRLGLTGIFYGLLVFVTASGIDAINQGVRGISDQGADEAHLVPFTENKPWWPTQSLEDSLKGNREQLLELGNQIRMLVSSRLNSGSRFNMLLRGTMPIVIPLSSTVLSGTVYEADIFVAASIQQTLAVSVDGKSISMEAYSDGVKKGKISFTASANRFDNSGMARKNFVAEIKVGDSTYTKVVEYAVIKPE